MPELFTLALDMRQKYPPLGIGWEFGIDMYTHYYIKIDNQQGPDVQHRELRSIFCNNPNGKRI